jgi:hypothetical protein
MNFNETLEELRTGKKARRPHWGKEEYMWANEKILIHTTPYFAQEKKRHGLFGHYPYVAEIEDIKAVDWQIIS